MSYFLFIYSEIRGPYQEVELRDMLAHREIQSDALACKEGDSEWTTLEVCLGLSSQSQTIRPSPLAGITNYSAPAPRSFEQEYRPKVADFNETESKRFGHESRPELKSRLWQAAALLVFAYAFVVVISAVFYRWWSGEWDDARSMIRLTGRAVASLSVAQGLLHAKGWAYWAAIGSACLLTGVGIAALSCFMDIALLSKRPYPFIDLGLFCLTLGIALSLVVILSILPFRKQSVRAELSR
jgi:hypothetical protein